MNYFNINVLRLLPIMAVALMGVFFTSTAALADTPAATAGDTATAEVEGSTKKKRGKKKKSKMICKRERVTGSHMRQRVCRTPEQIEQRRLEDKRTLETLVRPSGVGSSS